MGLYSGFFDVDDWLAGLTAKNDYPERLKAFVHFQIFRAANLRGPVPHRPPASRYSFLRFDKALQGVALPTIRSQRDAEEKSAREAKEGGAGTHGQTVRSAEPAHRHHALIRLFNILKLLPPASPRGIPTTNMKGSTSPQSLAAG